MNKITISNNHLKIDVTENDNGTLALTYLGTENNFLNDKATNHHFIELETSEGDHLGNNCSKFCFTPYGTNAKYISHKIQKNKDRQELIIFTSDTLLEIETHISLYDNISSFSVYNIVKNINNDSMTLERISSFYIDGFGQDSNPVSRDLYLHYASNSWHCEAQWHRQSFMDLGIFSGNDRFSMKSFKISNTGSWSTKDYLPMCIIENARNSSFLLAQIENNGSWNFELGENNNNFYFSAHGPDMLNNHWVKILKPGEIFETVPVSVAIGDSFENVIQEITKTRRLLIRPSLDNKELPVIFNDYMHALWDTQTEELIWPLVDLASELGCEEFVIDAGWFAKGCGWTKYIGAWQEYSDNFPTGGLKGTMDYISSKGMKCGIWYEIENMGTKSDICPSLPDDWFFQVNGKRIIRNTRNCLNFDNPDVYKWAMELVSKGIEEYHLDYIKNDYNLDSGIGNECNADSAGDGLLKHNRAFIKWLNELRDKYPNLTIENCGSGGCRMDYAMLKVCSIQSTSDQTDYRKYPYLSSAVLTAAIPEQAAVWSYPLNQQINEVPTDEVVAMNMVNAMLGRIHLSSYINKLTKKQIDLVKEGVQYFKDTREFKKGSLPIFPNGISYFFDKNVVGGLIKDKSIMLCVWNTSGSSQEIQVNLKKYDIVDVKVGYPITLETKFTFKNGILTFTSDNPYQGRVFEIKLK